MMKRDNFSSDWNPSDFKVTLNALIDMKFMNRIKKNNRYKILFNYEDFDVFFADDAIFKMFKGNSD
jgi:hypothetical protein